MSVEADSGRSCVSPSQEEWQISAIAERVCVAQGPRRPSPLCSVLEVSGSFMREGCRIWPRQVLQEGLCGAVSGSSLKAAWALVWGSTWLCGRGRKSRFGCCARKECCTSTHVNCWTWQPSACSFLKWQQPGSLSNWFAWKNILLDVLEVTVWFFSVAAGRPGVWLLPCWAGLWEGGGQMAVRWGVRWGCSVLCPADTGRLFVWVGSMEITRCK